MGIASLVENGVILAPAAFRGFINSQVSVDLAGDAGELDTA
jgi:hypothetical protein